jgi:hypothetical protein
MRLEVSVHMYGAEVPAQSWTLTELDQAESIGMKVGRVVRDFVRTRPLRKGGTRLQLDVRTTWREDNHGKQAEPKPIMTVSMPKGRRRKRGK